jgi:hypothetical protein
MTLPASLAVLCLSGLLGTNLSVQPTWQTDYRTARNLSIEQNKPLAVFISKGKNANLSKLTDETAKLLKTNFVVLTINSEDTKGKSLAEAFEMVEGVVISDRTGAKQALRVDGETNPNNLSQTLARMVEPEPTAPAPSIASQFAPSYLTTPAPVCRT